MKAIMLSIQPYYVFLIIARIMGWSIPQDKTVEIRKDCPKDSAWNRQVHIYCSKSKKSFNRIPKEYQPLMAKFLGKVIGEFVCDRIMDSFLNNNDGWFIECGCLTQKEIDKYQGNNPILYGLHITDLKIYDKPKELGEFYSTAYQKRCGYCTNLCEYYPDCSLKANRKPLTRPPQSWCYVEELRR